MSREQQEILIPTKAEISEAVKLGREIVGCSALKSGPLIYMTVGFRNADTSTVLLGPVGGWHLLRALKALVPDTEQVGASPVKTTERGLEVQEGYVSICGSFPNNQEDHF